MSHKKKIIDTLHNYNFHAVTFAGGEPFLDKELIQIIKYAKHKGLYVGLSTNGLLISKELLQQLNEFLDELTLPIDGSTAAVHNLHRDSLKQFQAVMELLPQINCYKFNADISTVVTRRNKHDLQNILDILLAFNIRRWKLFQFYPLGPSTKSKSIYELRHREWRALKSELISQVNYHSYPIYLFFRQAHDAIMRSYINLSPSGDILLIDNGVYNNIGNILEEKNLTHTLSMNSFNFACYNTRHFDGQYGSNNNFKNYLDVSADDGILTTTLN